MSRRRDIRRRVVQLMQADAALYGPTGLLQEIYDHTPADVGGRHPVLCMMASSSNVWTTFRRLGTVYALKLMALAKYAEISADARLVRDLAGDAIWTEADAFDSLDAISEALRLWVQANTKEAGGLWIAIDYGGRSAVDVVTIGGTTYLRETVDLLFGDQ